MKQLLQNKYVLIGLTLLVGALIGWVIKPSTSSISEPSVHEHIADASGIWTCSMHPQIRQNEPGQCPICGMDLIPLESDMDMSDPMAVTMTPTAIKLANVVTQVVGVGKASKSIRLNGKVMENEQQVYTQSSHIPGRVESLTVDFTGDFVQKGQTIATIYSPELVTAQQELFEVQKIMDSQPELFEAARKKLLNWKLTNAQIDKILENGKPIETIPIRAERSGYVKQKMVNLGDYIKQGMPIYMIADLSKVWVMFEGYESDMKYLKKGAAIEFTIASLPGEVFTSKISYIDPVINPKTRVAKLRVEMNNSGNQLKPEMFASGKLKSNVAPTDELIIPKSAVMWTGQRSVVYVKTTSEAGTSFKMRTVTLGAALGDSYVINEGLEAGEEIVVNGAFSVDAAAQLAGKPSMMSPEGGAAMTGHNHGGDSEIKNQPAGDQFIVNVGTKTYKVPTEFQDQIHLIFANYLDLKDALVASNSTEAKSKAKNLNKSIVEVDMKLVKEEAHTEWMKDLEVLKATATAIGKEGNLENMRMILSPLSDQLYHTLKKFQVEVSGYRQFCPMAMNNVGAYWLSDSDKILNPYFGDAMLTCGNVEEKLK
jgi:Cu(I)/Ag(I) efflux system membrane fusion protein